MATKSLKHKGFPKACLLLGGDGGGGASGSFFLLRACHASSQQKMLSDAASLRSCVAMMQLCGSVAIWLCGYVASLKSFWNHFGTILGLFLNHVGIIFGSCWNHVGIMLGLFGDFVWIMLSPEAASTKMGGLLAAPPVWNPWWLRGYVAT